MSLSLIDPAQHKQLFLDDYAVEETKGLRRSLHQPMKCGPLLRPDTGRGQRSLQSRSSPQWNSLTELWEWYYYMMYDGPPAGERKSTELRVNGFASSVDGVIWLRKSLGLYEWRGSRDNNIPVDPQGQWLYHILRDEREEDADRRYKALFGTRDRAPRVSRDGFVWTALDVPPIPSQDESHLIYDETTEQFVALVKQPTEWGRSVWISTSRDFEDWSKPELVFHSDEVDRDNRRRRIQEVIDDPDYLTPALIDEEDRIAQVYQMAVMPYEGIYVGFPVLFNPAAAIPPPHGNYTALNQVELTVSRDLRHWDRVADRAIFIGIDPWDGDNYGTAQNLLCGRPIVHEDREIRFYYNALRFRGPKELYDKAYHRYFDDAGALCLARLRLDGFVSLDTAGTGTVMSKPFVARGRNLYVNADAGGGDVSAEVVDAETMEPLPGLSRKECHPVSGDHLRKQIAWRNDPSLKGERPVRVHFTLRHASLYAFWLKDE